jgi:hypothetical protein
MNDQMDRRLEELVNQLAAAAPDAPPYPRVPATTPGRERFPSWALVTAGAVAVLIMIGLPFILFGGGSREDPVITSLTSTSVTSPPSTTPTSVVPPTTITPTTIDEQACPPAGLIARTLTQDGAAGQVATPVRFVNVTGDTCTLTDPVAVTGIGAGGEEIPATQSTYVPIAPDGGPELAAGESRTMLLETGTACDAGRPIGPMAESVRITFPGGDVTVPFTGDLGCTFSYAGFGQWFDEEVTQAEENGAKALRTFAADPSPENFAAVPLAESVTLTLGPQSGRSQPADTLRLPANWVFDTSFDGFRAYVGPFSALDLLAQDRPVEVAAGPHDHCASPPMPAYPDFEGLRQISIQPMDATSCLEWWTVDLFMNAAGEIAGVTLDLFEP